MTSRFSLRRVQVTAATAALVLVMIAVTSPAVQALAEGLLSVFRVKTVQPLTISSLGQKPNIRPEDFVKIVAEEKGQAKTFASVEAARAAGYAVRTPVQLPAGANATPEVAVQDASQIRFTVDRAKAEAALASAGLGGVTLDPKLDGAEFRIQIPDAVVVSYGEGLTIAQAKSPELLGPAGLDYDQLRAQALTVLGAAAPDMAAGLAAIGDWRTTLPIPMKSDTPRRTVTVDGVEGLLIEGQVGKESKAGATSLVWQKGGVVYGVMGTATAADLRAAANSLQ